MHRARARGGTSGAGGEPGRPMGRAGAAPPSPGIPPKRAKVTAEQGAAEGGPARLAAPAFVRKLKNAAIGTGCDIRLRVVAVGNPRPSLRWYRNEEQLAPHEEEYGTLWIRDSKKEDAGVYTCIAENERGEAMTSAVLAIIDMEGKDCAAPASLLRLPRGHRLPRAECGGCALQFPRAACPGASRGWAPLCLTHCRLGWRCRWQRGSSVAWERACGCSTHCQDRQGASAGHAGGRGMWWWACVGQQERETERQRPPGVGARHRQCHLLWPLSPTRATPMGTGGRGVTGGTGGTGTRGVGSWGRGLMKEGGACAVQWAGPGG